VHGGRQLSREPLGSREKTIGTDDVIAIALFSFAFAFAIRQRRKRPRTRGEIREAARQEFGSLIIQGATLHFVLKGAEIWSLPVDSLVLIGEHTNENGPFACDYFLVFSGGFPLVSFEAPMYAGPEVLAQLSTLLGADLQPGLVNSARFKSRVIWPQPLADQPLFEYRPVNRTGIARVFDRLLPLVGHDYMPAVQSYLRTRLREDGRCPTKQWS
jgi:hypothetical protein